MRECVHACARVRELGGGGGGSVRESGREGEKETGREGERERGGMRMDCLSNHLCRFVNVCNCNCMCVFAYV